MQLQQTLETKMPCHVTSEKTLLEHDHVSTHDDSFKSWK
jgi:hypothetical protein